MHVVIAGAGEVATHIAELLMARHPVALVVPEGAASSRLDLLDAQVIRGSATSAETFERLGVGPRSVFVAATDSDEMNLVACVVAKRVGVGRTLCLLSKRVGSQHNDDVALSDTLGIDRIVRPAEELAEEILRIVCVPGALDAQQFERGKVRLLRHLVEAGSPITAAPLKSLPLPANVVLVMGRRGDQAFIPQGDTKFEPGDKVTAMGSPRGVHELLYRFLRSSTHGRDGQTAMIVGGGSVGVAVARSLENQGWSVRVIEAGRERCESLGAQLRGLVIHGDGTDIDLLEQEHATDSAVLLALTDNDEKNLLVSLIGRALGVPRVITRADRLTNERLFERVGVDVVRSARGAAIRRVVQDIIEPRFAVRAELEHGDVHIVEVELPPEFPPTPLWQMATNLFAIVGAVVRGDQVVIPHGNTELLAGDHLLVVTSLADEEAARDHFSTPLPPGPG